MTWHDREHSEEFTNQHSILNDKNHYWHDSSGRRPRGGVPPRLSTLRRATGSKNDTRNDNLNRLSIEWSANASRRLSNRNSILNPEVDASLPKEKGCWRYTTRYNFDQIGKAMLRTAYL